MAGYKAPLRDMRFTMNEVLGFVERYRDLPGADEATPDMVDAILEEAAKFAEHVLGPLNAEGDRIGCAWKDGRVTMPPGFRKAWNQYVEAGWPGLSQPPRFGGQGLPHSLNAVVHEMLASSNHAWAMTALLNWGAINTINAHAPAELQGLFLARLVGGSWTGTMCLTEAHAGSDLGLLRTRARPRDDGSYAISGNKMFISSGEHDLTENIVHIVLARLPDAPQGVKGISLFIVPKYWIDEDGSVGAANGVSCGSIEHKMGLNGSATCEINFDDARGFLIGAPNKGMSAMFTFINESRLGVAQQALAHIEASFQGAAAYASERLQMRAPVRTRADKPADPIIAHPDVRRMLLTQKALAEGGRLLTYYCAGLVDLVHASNDPDTRKHAETELALLTPIAKGFLSEVSLEATSHGIQVLGGHGFISESGIEQELRDTRITTIYEGTTSIQGLDLLGRKIIGTGSRIMSPFAEKIKAFCDGQQPDQVKPWGDQLLQNLDLWQNLTEEIGKLAPHDPNAVGAAAVDYLMIAGYTTVAYFLARSAAVAARKLETESSDADFYNAKLATARFYFDRLLPRNLSLAASIRSGSDNLMKVSERSIAIGLN